MSDEELGGSPQATPEEMKSDKERKDTSEVTPEEWQASVDSLTPEELELFERIQSEINFGETRISFDYRPKEGDSNYELAEEESSWESYKKILKDGGYNDSEIEELKKADETSLLEARQDVIERLVMNNALLSQPSLVTVVRNDVLPCRLPHEGVRETMRLITKIKYEQEKYISAIRAFNNLLVLNYKVPVKGMERDIKIENGKTENNSNSERKLNPNAPQAIPFSETAGRYEKYFKDGKAISEIPNESKNIVKSENYGTRYSEHFLRAEDSFSKLFKMWFRGERVIDLGCGSEADLMADMVFQSGAREYIGVDKYYLADNVNHNGKREDIGCIAVKDDILTFLKNEPDGSATLMINGLDEFVFDTQRSETKYYIERLAKEIERVVGENHKVVGIESFPIFNELEKLGYKSHRINYPNEFQSIERLQKSESMMSSKLLDDLVNHRLGKEKA